MPSYLISSKLRRKLLAFYFIHPEERYYLRELALRLKIDPGNLSRELRRLTREGLFLEIPKGRIKFYALNTAHPLYSELKQILSKTEGVEGSLRELVGRFPAIETAFIYGSYARGEEKSTSDIDLLMVGSTDRRSLTSQIRKLEDHLGREINFNLYAPEDFYKKLRQKGGFLAEVVKGKKIMLKGSLNG